MTEQPRRVIPPAASPSSPAQPPARPRPSPAKDFPPLALILLGLVFGAGGGAMLVLDSTGIRALGIVLAVLGQTLLLIGTIAQGVYIGTAKARDRGLL